MHVIYSLLKTLHSKIDYSVIFEPFTSDFLHWTEKQTIQFSGTEIIFLRYLLTSRTSYLDMNFAGRLLTFLVVPYFTFVWLMSDVVRKLTW